MCLGAAPVFRFGTEEQKRHWLPALCSGEKLAAFGLTEPGGGTDVPGGMRTTARLERSPGGAAEWVLNGSKAFITNAGTDITALVTVAALTGEREISTFCVPAGTPGLHVSKKYSKVGWAASDTRELSFSEARVPEASLLGPRGRGYAQFLAILDEGRVAIAALATGLAQGCVDECLRYAAQRSAFGRAIGEYQVHPVHDRGHGGPHRSGPGHLVRGRGAAGGRASRPRRPRPSPSWWRPTRPWTTRGMPPRSSAATGS